jgi:hypothetical protein
MSLTTPSCVQKLQAASHGISCVFSESRMREICQSASMSGNRKQSYAKTGLRRVMRKHPNSHREAKATEPVLDSTRDYTSNPANGPCAGTIAFRHTRPRQRLSAVVSGPSATRMIFTCHLNKNRIRPDGHSREESLRIPLLNRGPVQVRILRPLGSSPRPQTIQQGFVVSRTSFMPNDSPEPLEPPNVDTILEPPITRQSRRSKQQGE